MCSSLAQSDYTSIQLRIKQFKSHQRQAQRHKTKEYSVPLQPTTLVPFTSVENTNDIPFSLHDYLELVDWSGRHIDPKKTGYIAASEPKILKSLGIEQKDWLEAVQNFRRHYGNFSGEENHLRQCAHQHGQSWYKGVG